MRAPVQPLLRNTRSVGARVKGQGEGTKRTPDAITDTPGVLVRNKSYGRAEAMGMASDLG